MSDETAMRHVRWSESQRGIGIAPLSHAGPRGTLASAGAVPSWAPRGPRPLMSGTASVRSVNAAGSPAPGQVRLAELVAALSLGIDLGFGQPMEHVLRQSMISMRLAETVGLGEDERSVTYYTALLVNVGCHTDAHEQAKWFGDDIALKANKYEYELGSMRGALAMMRQLGSGNSPLHRFRIGMEFAVSGRHDLDQMIEHHAALARGLAEQLGLPEVVQEAVGTAYEQWDGKGWPGNLSGEAIPLASRLAAIGEFTEVAHRIGGVTAAVDLAEKRAGSQFDPELAASLLPTRRGDFGRARRRRDLGRGDRGGAFARRLPVALRVRPGPSRHRGLRRPEVAVHPRARPRCRRTRRPRLAATVGLNDAEVALLRRAGVVHGLGRLGVSNAIWDKKGTLGAGEWERVRMHPYLTERMLSQSDALAPLGALAATLRERLDGSGYPRRLSGAAIPLSARVLGAADAYQAMCEPRPYRDALSPDAVGRGAAGRGKGGPDGRRRRRGGARRGGASCRPPPRGPRWPHTARGGRAATRLPRSSEQGDRRAPCDLTEDGAQPHRAHLFQDRRLEPRRRQPLRRPTRTACRGGTASRTDS